jgi:hypothetical protein
MFTRNLSTTPKIDPARLQIHWVVKPAPRAYTFEECFGNLAEEIGAEAASGKIEADPSPSLEAEDFEAAYQWFYS